VTTATEKAQQILATDPLPADAREQIGKLKKDIDPTEYKWILEGLAVAEMDSGQFET
jgi:hypothetical protein